MSVQLRWEQCCEVHGCLRPARFGALCTACYNAATPARRAIELGARAAPCADDVVDPAGAAWLSQLWAA